MLACLPLLIGFLAKAQAEPTSTLNTTSTLPALTRTSSPPSDHILAISENMWEPVVTNINGDVDKITFGFEYSFEADKWGLESSSGFVVSPYSACAIEHQNQFYILGDSHDLADQISRVDDCQLTRVGSLEREMKMASCTTIGNTIFMCFSQDEDSTCYKGSDPFSLTAIDAESSYGHSGTYVAASNDSVFVVGGHGDDHHHVATELLNVETSLWSTRASYPYESSITQAQTLHLNGDFYVFGGYRSEPNDVVDLSHIASYSPTTDTWSSRGNLLTPRSYPGVIWAGDAFLIMGGRNVVDGIESSEKCHFNDNDQIECAYQNPTQPTRYTHLFKVPENYCAGSNTAINTAITPTLMCLVTLLQIFQF
jgi:hypothetical protein